jgi:hypothetical protein
MQGAIRRHCCDADSILTCSKLGSSLVLGAVKTYYARHVAFSTLMSLDSQEDQNSFNIICDNYIHPTTNKRFLISWKSSQSKYPMIGGIPIAAVL